ACDEVAAKAVPVVEPHGLSEFSGLPPIQVDVLKITLHAECPDQGFPEGGLQEIFCLHMQREILHPLFGIPTLDSFGNGFLDRHNQSPAPPPRLNLRPASKDERLRRSPLHVVHRGHETFPARSLADPPSAPASPPSARSALPPAPPPPRGTFPLLLPRHDGQR